MPSRLSVSRLPASLGASDLRQQDFGFIADDQGATVDALGMGVLSDGTPFLTQRGLAALCGVENAHISTISSQWVELIEKPRIRKIREILESHGVEPGMPHTEHKVGGKEFFVYKEAFCLAVLEYYAFEAGQFVQPEALKHYRLLAGKGLRDFIYEALGYKPKEDFDQRWQPFLDRVSKTYNVLPVGYFSIFREIADMVVTLGERGVFMTDKLLPDISVGKAWSQHWTANSLAATYGDRTEYEHNYPDYFPQSISNPQHPWCYPESSLGEFRRWFRDIYIGEGKFESYIAGQVRAKKLAGDVAGLALSAYRADSSELLGA